MILRRDFYLAKTKTKNDSRGFDPARLIIMEGARAGHRPRVPKAAAIARILQGLEVTRTSRVGTRHRVPRAAVCHGADLSQQPQVGRQRRPLGQQPCPGREPHIADMIT